MSIQPEDIVSEYREIEGFYVKPCVGSGFCCTKSPCGYGEFNEERTQCKYLSAPNEFGQKGCERYDWIKENVMGWEFYPGFGGGCCMNIFNEMRDNVIKNLPEEIRSKIR